MPQPNKKNNEIIDAIAERDKAIRNQVISEVLEIITPATDREKSHYSTMLNKVQSLGD